MKTPKDMLMYCLAHLSEIKIYDKNFRIQMAVLHCGNQKELTSDMNKFIKKVYDKLQVNGRIIRGNSPSKF